MADERHYRTRRNRFLFYPFSVLGIPLGIIVAVSPKDSVVAHVWLAACVIFMIWLTRNARRLGLATGMNGIIVYGVIRARHVDWHDVAGLDTHRWSINTVVDVELKGGEKLNTNLIQGVPVTWQHQKTRDILGTLKEDFRSHGVAIGGGASRVPS